MKNTIIFNLNTFNCDCLSMINDGTNQIVIEARKNNFSVPTISFTLADETTATASLTPSGGIVSYTIPAAYYNLTGSISFTIIDGAYSSPEVTITGAEIAAEDSLTLIKASNTAFRCNVSAGGGSGGDFNQEWQDQITANTAARHGHSNKAAIDLIDGSLTNQEIQDLLDGADSI